MAYTKHTWATSEVITATLLNNLETQYDCILTDYINQAVKTTSSPSFVDLTLTGNLILSTAAATVDGVDISAFYTAYGSHAHAALYAPIAKGVTNGDTHDHLGGDGGTIAHTSLSAIGTNSHATIDSHLSAASPHSGHVVANTAITGATYPKITFDAKGLVTGGAALAAGDIPAHSTTLLTSGTLGIARGGTGLSTIAAGGILYASALDTLARIAPSAANQVLRSTAANAAAFGALLAADIPVLDTGKITTGTLPTTRGGTGLASFTAGSVLYASTTAVISQAAPSAANQVLRSTAANAFSWGELLAADIPALDTGKMTTGTLGVARGGTGVATVATGGILKGAGTAAMVAAAPTAAYQFPKASAAGAWAWGTIGQADTTNLRNTDSPSFLSITLAIAATFKKYGFQCRGGGPETGSNSGNAYSATATAALTETHDTDACYGAGAYTAQGAGYYHFDYTAAMYGWTGGNGMIQAYLAVYSSAPTLRYYIAYSSAANSGASNEYLLASASAFVYLYDGDTVSLIYKYKRGEHNATSAALWHFSGFKFSQ